MTIPAASPSTPKSKRIKFESPQLVPEGKLVNTFRVGDDWKDKMKTGATVSLEPVEGEAFGSAKVGDVITGKWADLKTLAVDNHSFAGTKVGGAEAQDLLLGELKRFYPKFDPAKDDVTVIYFERTKK